METLGLSTPYAARLSPRQLCLLFALALGILGDRLLWAGPGGPGFALWIGLLGAAAVFLAWRAGLPWRREIAPWSALALAAAAGMFLRESDFLVLAMCAVLLVSASMVVMRGWGARLGETWISDHVWAFAMLPARALGGAFPLLSAARLPPASARRRLGSVARGLLLAAPLLLVFGALFSSADATFGRYAARVIEMFGPELPAHIALALLLGWVAAGLLSAVPATEQRNPLRAFPLPRIGSDETLVVMGLLSLLFTGFVLLQLGYLFGGREVIESISGLTVAEHARRGFFEMLAAAALTLAVLIGADSMTENRRIFRPLAALLILCVLVMLASALQRLALYIGDYGLSLDRVNALAVMAWLAATLVLFAATVLLERPLRFASGAALAGILIAFVLLLANPAALVARVNLARGIDEGRSLDVGYLVSLGPDAVPVLMGRFDELPGLRYVLSLSAEDAAVLRGSPAGLPLAAACRSLAPLLTLGNSRPRGLEDWRVWNAGEAAAWQAIEARRGDLALIGERCGPPGP